MRYGGLGLLVIGTAITATGCAGPPAPRKPIPVDGKVAGSGTVIGDLVVIDGFEMPELGSSRTIRIWLPPDYEGSARPYPVLYMHDGQNLFDASTSFAGEWKIDEAMTAFAADPGGGRTVIVVGIDNGGRERMNEYSPFLDRDSPAPKGDRYVDFIADTLKPWVDSRYRTLPGREDTAIGGSSMGGLISLYAVWRRPEAFSKALCLSSAFWIGDRALLKLVKEGGISRDLKVYIDVGGRERGNAAGDRAMAADSKDMYDALLSAGIPASELRFVLDPAAVHNEAAWAARFPGAWAWLAGHGSGD